MSWQLVSDTSAIIAFYTGGGRDRRGHTLNDILTWDDDTLEFVHDYIQWLFPLNERSMFNDAAPILTTADIEAFRDDPALRQNLHRSFVRILAFYGFALAETGAVPVVAPGPEFTTRAKDWI